MEKSDELGTLVAPLQLQNQEALRALLARLGSVEKTVLVAGEALLEPLHDLCCSEDSTRDAQLLDLERPAMETVKQLRATTVALLVRAASLESIDQAAAWINQGQTGSWCSGGPPKPSFRRMDRGAGSLDSIDAAAALINQGLVRFVVVFLPRRSDECIARLRSRTGDAVFEVDVCGIHMFRTSDDILSMALPHVFRDYHVNGDTSSLFFATRAIAHLESLLGVVPVIHTIGEAAKASAEIMSWPNPPVANAALTSPFDAGVLIDRRVDPYSLFLKELSYDALLDASPRFERVYSQPEKVFKIQHLDDRPPTFQFPPRIGSNEDTQKSFRIDEPLFCEMKMLHVDDVGPFLRQSVTAFEEANKTAMACAQAAGKQQYTDKHNQQYKHFLEQKVRMKFVESHLNVAELLIAELIKDGHLKAEAQLLEGFQSGQKAHQVVEETVMDSRPLHDVLRIACLASLVPGLPTGPHIDVTKDVLHGLGFEFSPLLGKLEKLGWYQVLQGKSEWPKLNKRFNLWEPGETRPKFCEAYAGYVPLSVRLVQGVCDGTLKEPPAAELDLPSEKRRDPMHLVMPLGSCLRSSAATGMESAVTVLVFLGGITRGEIASLRALEESYAGRRRFLIVASEIICARQLFQSMAPREE